MTDPIHVAIRSYKRAGTITTLQVVPFAYVYVPESQGDAYRQSYGDRVITIPDDEDGNTCRKFNSILNRTPSKWTVILDDDITFLGYWERGRHFKMRPKHIYTWMLRMFNLADELGVHLWGINQNKDPLIFRAYTPFSMLSPILGPFTGHLSPELRYDESVPLKEDYDFWLQNIWKYHFTLRANKYHYSHDHGKKPGGVVSMRSMEEEEKNILRMRQKWGRYFSYGGTVGGKSATGKNILNSNVNIPIKGV